MNTLEVILKQETPMIHFESELSNATIRGTELKPKIDNFILEELKVIDSQLYDEYKSVIDKENFGNGKQSPYKVNISGYTEEKEIPPFTPFFGNMGDNDKKAVIGKSDITINFFSFNEEVIKLVNSVLPYVFAYHNFGTRQNKGFGCFTPSFYSFNGDRKDYDYDLEEILKKKSKVYKKQFNPRSNDPFDSLKKIDENYKLIKSGKNFRGYKRSELMTYLYDQNIRWEKVKIKSEIYKNDERLFNKLKVTHPSKNKFTLDQEFETARFARALLGLAEFNEYSLNHGRLTVNIKDSKGEIDRFPSPITFKVKDNEIYIYSNTIDERMFNRKFTFDIDRNISFQLKTPTKEEFDLEDFLNVALKNLGFKEVN